MREERESQEYRIRDQNGFYCKNKNHELVQWKTEYPEVIFCALAAQWQNTQLVNVSSKVQIPPPALGDRK